MFVLISNLFHIRMPDTAHYNLKLRLLSVQSEHKADTNLL